MNIKKYLNEIKNLLSDNLFTKTAYLLKNQFINVKKNEGKIIIIGNGGSASTSSHVSVDLTKNAQIKSINFNESNLITCFANDFGFDNWISKSLNYYCDIERDYVVFLSVSGNSKNLVNGIKWCKKNNVKYATLTGSSKNNFLKKNNKDGINFWVNSKSYNVVEIIHHALLLTTVDLIIGKSIYKPN
jgi:D-sedoheptulose 7-phosphate isomerase